MIIQAHSLDDVKKFDKKYLLILLMSLINSFKKSNSPYRINRQLHRAFNPDNYVYAFQLNASFPKNEKAEQRFRHALLSNRMNNALEKLSNKNKENIRKIRSKLYRSKSTVQFNKLIKVYKLVRKLIQENKNLKKNNNEYLKKLKNIANKREKNKLRNRQRNYNYSQSNEGRNAIGKSLRL